MTLRCYDKDAYMTQKVYESDFIKWSQMVYKLYNVHGVYVLNVYMTQGLNDLDT